MTATRNNCVDRIRKRRVLQDHDKALHIVSPAPDPHEKMMSKEMVSRIRQSMTALPENQQLVIQLWEIEGFSYNEIAEVLDMSLDQVKINLFRGRNAIKKSIIKEEDTWSKLK